MERITEVPFEPNDIGAAIAYVTRAFTEKGGLGFAPKTADVFRDALVAYIDANPVYQQYVQHISAPSKHYNTLPWHAVGERSYAAWMCLAASVPGSTIKVHGMDPRVFTDRGLLLVPMAFMILGATPYLWADKMEKLADASPLPKHTVSPTVMPSPVMFWSRETAYNFTEESDGQTGSNNWICVYTCGEKLFLVGDWVNETTGEVGLVSFTMTTGKTWPDDYLGDAQTGIVLKRCAFLNSPFVGTNVARLAHHHRRQMARAGIAPGHVEEKIHVVKLRRAAGGPTKPPTGPGAMDPVEWKHQWWVNGHYRAQWYPTEEAHKVIWIAPFLKGPPDAPLLEKVYAVVR
jgi:hypothetical protein